MNLLAILLIIGHCIGMIGTFLFFLKTGAFKDAKIYGDGIRTASPADLLFLCIIWEFLVFANLLLFLAKTINNLPW